MIWALPLVIYGDCRERAENQGRKKTIRRIKRIRLENGSTSIFKQITSRKNKPG